MNGFYSDGGGDYVRKMNAIGVGISQGKPRRRESYAPSKSYCPGMKSFGLVRIVARGVYALDRSCLSNLCLGRSLRPLPAHHAIRYGHVSVGKGHRPGARAHRRRTVRSWTVETWCGLVVPLGS
jgi:hypothetical protein